MRHTHPQAPTPPMDRKTQIVGAALDLAFQVGPDQVTTGKIAQKLGVSQPAIYKHFGTKPEIWAAVADMLCARIEQNIEQAQREMNSSNLGRLRRLMLSHISMIAEFPALPTIMTMHPQPGTNPHFRTQMLSQMDRYRSAMVTLLARAKIDHDLRKDVDCADLATLLIGIIQGVALRTLFTREIDSLLRDGQRLIDLQLGAFAPHSAAAP